MKFNHTFGQAKEGALLRASGEINKVKKDPMMIMEILPFIFVAFIFLAVFYPVYIRADAWVFVGLFASGILVVSVFMRSALQIYSFGFVTPIHHSSLSRPGPWKIVSGLVSEKDELEGSILSSLRYGIFDMGGLSSPFPITGGGRYGYYIVPEGLYIINGGTVTVLSYPVRFAYNQLPKFIRDELLEHEHFHIGDPIFFALYPPKRITEEVKNAFGSKKAERMVSDYVTLVKMANEEAFLAEGNNRVNNSMFSDTLDRRRKNFRKEYTPTSRQEIERYVDDEDDK
jgi:hypothetical protein